MPWKIFDGCIHKLNADGSKGELVPGGCHSNPDDAKKHMAALYANEGKMTKRKKSRKVTLIEPQDEGEIETTFEEITPGETAGVKPEDPKTEEDKITTETVPSKPDEPKEDEKSLLERIKEVVFPKAVTASAQGCDKPASSFLVVPDPQKPSTWSLPVKDCSGKPDSKLMGAAHAALTVGFRGNTYQGPDKGAALSKLKAMYASEKMTWPSGKSLLTVVKDIKGQYHALGMVTNKWRDRDIFANPKNGGEILTESAHKEYMTFLDRHPEEAPHLVAWHEKKTATKAPAELWAYKDGFVFMSWPLEEKEAQGLMKVEEKFGPLGMSHEFMPIQKDHKQGLIHQYRMTEATHLPVSYAANLFTDFAVARMEVKDMGKFSEDKRKYFVEIYGEDITAGLEKESEERAKALDEKGVQSKDYDAENPTTKALEVIAEGITKIKEDQGKFSTEMKSLADRVTQVEKSDDQKVAEKIKPRLSTVMQIKPGEQGKEITEEEAKERAPKNTDVSWFKTAHQDVHG